MGADTTGTRDRHRRPADAGMANRAGASTITIEKTIAEIVRARPARSRVFEELGIDYCCGGKRSLAEACRARGLAPAAVLARLSAADAARDELAPDPVAMTLPELCDHIRDAHHGYLRDEFPRLDFMTRKVAATHGDREPRLLEVRRVFEALYAMIASHTREEDERIFPAIRALGSGGGDRAAARALAVTLAKMESEHDAASAALERLETLTDHHTPPDWACNTFRALYDGLARLQKNMRLHTHKENNVLFPRVLSMGGAA